jgi:hypothetical protein
MSLILLFPLILAFRHVPWLGPVFRIGIGRAAAEDVPPGDGGPPLGLARHRVHQAEGHAVVARGVGFRDQDGEQPGDLRVGRHRVERLPQVLDALQPSLVLKQFYVSKGPRRGRCSREGQMGKDRRGSPNGRWQDKQ